MFKEVRSHRPRNGSNSCKYSLFPENLRSLFFPTPMVAYQSAHTHTFITWTCATSSATPGVPVRHLAGLWVSQRGQASLLKPSKLEAVLPKNLLNCSYAHGQASAASTAASGCPRASSYKIFIAPATSPQNIEGRCKHLPHFFPKHV